MQDVFYNIRTCYEPVLRECFDLAIEKRVDVKDKSYHRTESDMPPEEALKLMFEKKSHRVFIHRMNWPHTTRDGIELPRYFEIGGCTMDREFDVFLFLILGEDDALKVMRKYDLQIL